MSIDEKPKLLKLLKKEISVIQEWNSSLDMKLDAAHVATENLQKFLADHNHMR